MLDLGIQDNPVHHEIGAQLRSSVFLSAFLGAFQGGSWAGPSSTLCSHGLCLSCKQSAAWNLSVSSVMKSNR